MRCNNILNSPHIILNAVLVAEWPRIGKEMYTVDHMFSLYFDYLLFLLFPVLVLRVGFGF